jgi:hypothetical protein
MSARDRSCEERIGEHKETRLADFRDLTRMANVYDDATRDELAEDGTLRRAEERVGIDRKLDPDDLAETARELMQEYPLGVSAQTVFRVELSTGGPADWLEVICSGDTPNYEPAGDGEHYEVERIVYHFADWFDHAEVELRDDDLTAAEEFVSQVVAELIA